MSLETLHATIYSMGADMTITQSDIRIPDLVASVAESNGGLAPRRSTSDQDSSVDLSVTDEVRTILWSAQLSSLRRFNWQPYWEDDSAASDKALQIENSLPLENVAEHSWKVADMAMFLYHLVPNLNRSYCIELAILHDKLELITGDYSPIDDNATGQTTHAFNDDRAMAKKANEHGALERYLRLLPVPVREYQRHIIEDAIDIRSEEAKFVNALDKLSALAYIVAKKDRGLRGEHLQFTKEYSRKAVLECPQLLPHHALLISMLKQLENSSLVATGGSN